MPLKLIFKAFKQTFSLPLYLPPLLWDKKGSYQNDNLKLHQFIHPKSVVQNAPRFNHIRRIGQRTDLTLVQNALKLTTADDIGGCAQLLVIFTRSSLKTTADEIEEEYTLIGLIRMKPFH